MSSLAVTSPLLFRVRVRVRSPTPFVTSSLRLLSPNPLSLTSQTLTPSLPGYRRRLTPTVATSATANEDLAHNYAQWDSITAKFAAAANVPFLLLQLPQILLSAQNLIAGNKTALFAVPWLGMLTGLLGNLSLLSYFAKKKETEAVLVQTLGVISTYVVIAQLAMAESMPLPHFLVTSAVVGLGLVLNFLNYFGWLNEGVWRAWEDFITVGGLSVLPQVKELK